MLTVRRSGQLRLRSCRMQQLTAPINALPAREIAVPQEYYPAPGYQFQGIMRPASPMVESMPLDMMDMWKFMALTSVASTGSAFIW